MKKYIALSILSVIAVVGVLFSQKASANPSTISRTYLTGTATTSGQFLTSSGGATTTVVAYIERYDQYDLNLLLEGSTTASVLNFQVAYSDDVNCVSFPLTCNWYTEDYESTSGSLRTQSPFSMRVWAPVSNATSTKDVKFTNLGARYVRFNFAAQGANERLWAEIVGKVQQP